ncbi:MAG: nucleotide pyrophosphohydrolase [Candidatus Bathyarchaeota archaeon]|uniref:MazG nucleotide pyrophosphohydrolase domain-containing protein n=1 Tax=Candidatus Bathycorpusculum sp. TaxID=2994959 RepID=UPI00281BE72D|nr:nucleotide pyrophosphohydrolase [Candidatus Termiticorpusculum sp.]MCL2257217.1 nucleotide pyrophosphohydrolase [Candidatus Termiticorpusculum sp.]MCL2292325.1 nucleotide pyrophosphohydrolase [Candidatus Termiticorpusculum sp.]
MQIYEFQKMMEHLYIKSDKKRGVEATFKWLNDELQELKEALNNKDKTALEKEFADVLAWLASLANITEVNLEKAALEKYQYKCPKCQQAPCTCKFIKVKSDVSAQHL